MPIANVMIVVDESSAYVFDSEETNVEDAIRETGSCGDNTCCGRRVIYLTVPVDSPEMDENVEECPGCGEICANCKEAYPDSPQVDEYELYEDLD